MTRPGHDAPICRWAHECETARIVHHHGPNQAATRYAVRISMPEPIVLRAGDGRHTNQPSCRQPSLEALCAQAQPALE